MIDAQNKLVNIIYTCDELSLVKIQDMPNPIVEKVLSNEKNDFIIVW